MKKAEAFKIIKNTSIDKDLKNSNTTIASIGTRRPVWWMNIKLHNFEKDWNIILVGKEELYWLFIPAFTFQNLSSFFRIWEAKNAVDIYISSDPYDRFFHDVASGSSGINFKPFIVDKFKIPEELKNLASEGNKTVHRSKAEEPLSGNRIGYSLRQGQRILKENEKNVSYKSLFAEYLEGSKKIIIQDPYIRYPHQFKNLLEFSVMLGKNKIPEKEIHLEIVTWNSEEFHRQSKAYFDEVVASVSDLRINLSYRFEEHHDRYIEADNGWKIILGRGLDIFQKPEGRFSLGDIDQSKRKCKACEITFLKI